MKLQLDRCFAVALHPAVLALLLLSETSLVSAAVETPPQYISISFDGSYNIPMWQKLRDEAKLLESKFTFFISGVYYLARPDGPPQYVDPRHTDGSVKGKSDIGFSTNVPELASRIQQMDLAMNEGLAVGSHVNGHFDGGKWTLSQWLSEFTQFHHFIEHVFDVNPRLAATDPKSSNSLIAEWPTRLHEALRGFRAPLLSRNADTDQVLIKFGYQYDASRVASMNTWPKRVVVGGQPAFWNFPLAEIPVAGTARKSISMDYNFYYTHSKGIADAANEKKYEDSYYHSLMSYFNNNYYGSRAPIHIGNHFSTWNGGAYFIGLMRFYHEVCHNPRYANVKCVNYDELVSELNRLEKQDAPKLAAWQAGQFDKIKNPTPGVAAMARGIDFKVELSRSEDGELIVDASVPQESTDDAILLARHQGDFRKLNNPDLYKWELQVSENKVDLDWQPTLIALDQVNQAALTGKAKIHLPLLSLGAKTDVTNYKVKVTITKIEGNLEILSATRDIVAGYDPLTRKSTIVSMSSEDDEAQALKGDHPNAHMGVNSDQNLENTAVQQMSDLLKLRLKVNVLKK